METEDLQMKGLTVRQGQFPGFVTFIISRILGMILTLYNCLVSLKKEKFPSKKNPGGFIIPFSSGSLKCCRRIGLSPSIHTPTTIWG